MFRHQLRLASSIDLKKTNFAEFSPILNTGFRIKDQLEIATLIRTLKGMGSG